MPSQNYVLLERIELNATTTSVTFSNIPQTGYTDLKIVVSARSNTTSANYDPLLCRFNGSTTGYTARTVDGNGSSAASSANTTLTSAAAGGTWWRLTGYGAASANLTASTFSNGDIYIPNYASANYKSVSVDNVVENNGASGFDELIAGLWSDTSAITSVSFALYFGSFIAGTTFSLYGIANASTTPAKAPKASGGNVIATDGTYWYHAFLSSGTFTPQVGLSCDYLVVAGGGGSAGGVGSGGGAGGLRSTVTATGGGASLESAISVAANTQYAITVGAGGAGAGARYAPGTQGSNSVFSTITSIGGGYGNGSNASGGSGGSGGGGTGTGTGGARTTGQGYAGGNGADGIAVYTGGGGGGGAGAVGQNAGVGGSNGGNGGVGVYTALTDAVTIGQLSSSHYYVAGGGGGATNAGTNGTGGVGGGGAAGAATGTAGTANTGGGGGASGDSGSFLGQAGGSGLVIIRYAA